MINIIKKEIDVEKFFIKFIQQLLDQKKNQRKIDDINGQKHKNTM